MFEVSFEFGDASSTRRKGKGEEEQGETNSSEDLCGIVGLLLVDDPGVGERYNWVSFRCSPEVKRREGSKRRRLTC